MKSVFVTGFSGAQGSAIASVLTNSGVSVTGLVRQASEHDGCVQGDLLDVASLVAAMRGCDAIVFTLPLIFEADVVVQMTQNLVSAARQNGIQKVVFNTGIPLGDTLTGYAAIDVKHAALEVLCGSDLSVVSLMPTIYLDNLAAPFLLPVIREHNIIPYPVASEQDFAWISHENLARYCYAALNNDALVGQKILITNRDMGSKADLAKLIAQKVGRDVCYVPSTTDQFEENLRPVLGDYVAREIANLYRGVAENAASFCAYSHAEFLDSVELQSTEQWVASVNW